MKDLVEIEIGGSQLKIETKRWAKQSNGSVVISYKDNIILVTANMKEAREVKDFLPLMVDFRESNYSAGKIPGGFFKREGKPSEREVLLSRLIDRPIRPLFPEGYFSETQVIAMLLSADFSIDYDSMGIIGASAALISSTIPFTTPLGAVKIGRKDGEFVINPGLKELDEMDMVLQVAGTEHDIVMMEAGGKEFDESVLEQGLVVAKEWITKICQSQKDLINPNKEEVEPNPEYEAIFSEMKKDYYSDLSEYIFIKDRDERKEKIGQLFEKIEEGIGEEEKEKKLPLVKRAFHQLESEAFRKTLLEKKMRNDHRKFDEIRSINIELGVLPRAHGSAVFTRGETQALATITLGSDDDAQRQDNIAQSGDLKRFMLHYNFPPFSVGEVSFLRGAGRREIGHGNLAEKSLSRVLPDAEKFPYTIRIVSEILESNGSSSMRLFAAVHWH